MSERAEGKRRQEERLDEGGEVDWGGIKAWGEAYRGIKRWDGRDLSLALELTLAAMTQLATLSQPTLPMSPFYPGQLLKGRVTNNMQRAETDLKPETAASVAVLSPLSSHVILRCEL